MRVESSQDQYLQEHFGIKDSSLEEIRKELSLHKLERMSMAGHELRILQLFIRSLGFKKLVEIGTLFGHTTLALAKVLPPDGHIWTIEKEPMHFAKSQAFFSKFNAQQITGLKGDAAEILSSIEKHGPFDFVLIDANKLGYVEYLNWAEKNVVSGGLIAGDNSFLFGTLWGENRGRRISEKQISIMEEFNRKLCDPEKFISAMIPTTEGLTIGIKK